MYLFEVNKLNKTLLKALFYLCLLQKTPPSAFVLVIRKHLHVRWTFESMKRWNFVLHYIVQEHISYIN